MSDTLVIPVASLICNVAAAGNNNNKKTAADSPGLVEDEIAAVDASGPGGGLIRACASFAPRFVVLVCSWPGLHDLETIRVCVISQREHHSESRKIRGLQLFKPAMAHKRANPRLCVGGVLVPIVVEARWASSSDPSLPSQAMIRTSDLFIHTCRIVVHMASTPSRQP